MLRPLTATEFPQAATLLAEGFTGRSPEAWLQLLRRLERHGGNAEARVPIGHLLVVQGQAVGIGLTPASLRPHAEGAARCRVNLSSLYVRPDQRWRAGLMLRAMTADVDATYVDLTPTPDISAMLGLLGFRPMSRGTWVGALPLLAWRPAGGAGVRALRPGDDLASDAPTHQQIEAHREFGCRPVWLEHEGGSTLFIYVRRRLRGMPAARLAYVGSHAALERHIGALARHLLARGIVWLSWDAREAASGPPGALLRPGGIWYARGPGMTDCSDFIGTEACLLGVW